MAGGAAGGLELSSLPWSAQLTLLVVAMFIAGKLVELVISLLKAAKNDAPPQIDSDSRIEVLRRVQGEVLSTYLQGSIAPILLRQTEILEALRSMSGQHHEALTRLGFVVDEMRAQQTRTHEGVHRLSNAIHDLIATVPKRRDDSDRV